MEFSKDVDEFLLYERLRMNDNAAYNFIYKQYFEKLIRHGLFRGIRLEDAQDIAQNTMTIFYGKIKDDSYQKQNNVKIISFLLKIHHFLCLELFKKREFKFLSYDEMMELNTYLEDDEKSQDYSTNKKYLDDENDEEKIKIEEPYTDDDIDIFLQIPKEKEDERYKKLVNNEKFGKAFLLLQEAFKTIGKDCQERLMLKKGYNYPYEELEEILGITKESVKNAVYRCVEKIRSFYKEKGFILKRYENDNE